MHKEYKVYKVSLILKNMEGEIRFYLFKYVFLQNSDAKLLIFLIQTNLVTLVIGVLFTPLNNQ